MKRRRRTSVYQPGLAPGTIRERTTTERMELEITIVDYSLERIEVRERADTAEVAAAPAGANRWIRIRGTPTTELMRQLGGSFSVHNLVLEDIMSSGQRIKVEDYENLMFTVLRTAHDNGNGELDESDLSIILTPDTLVTVYESADADFFAPIISRLENRESLLRHHRIDFLFHALLDLVVDRYFPVIQTLEERASELESKILEHAEERELRVVHQLRGTTQLLRGILWSMRDVASRIERSTHRFINEETLFYFRDIHDHIVHLLDAISTLRESANGLMELYMSGVSNRMNEVMKVLTIISTIFIPITFIAGVYGMNFDHMPELGQRWAYPAVLAVMGLIAIAMVIYFKRRRWF
ncbi:MAG: magnesium/cobalt transporter CorA [Spirochaetota bacterium]